MGRKTYPIPNDPFDVDYRDLPGYDRENEEIMNGLEDFIDSLMDNTGMSREEVIEEYLSGND